MQSSGSERKKSSKNILNRTKLIKTLTNKAKENKEKGKSYKEMILKVGIMLDQHV